MNQFASPLSHVINDIELTRCELPKFRDTLPSIDIEKNQNKVAEELRALIVRLMRMSSVLEFMKETPHKGVTLIVEYGRGPDATPLDTYYGLVLNEDGNTCKLHVSPAYASTESYSAEQIERGECNRYFLDLARGAAKSSHELLKKFTSELVKI